MDVRRGTPEDHVAVQRLLDGALLETADVPASLAAGDVYVAGIERAGERTLVGVLVCDGEHVEAVAVAPSRRGRGIGRALVAAALADRGRLTADFRDEVRAFWEAIGFDVVEQDDGRYWAVREA